VPEESWMKFCVTAVSFVSCFSNTSSVMISSSLKFRQNKFNLVGYHMSKYMGLRGYRDSVNGIVFVSFIGFALFILNV